MKISPKSPISDCFSHIFLREIKRIKKWRKVAIKGTDPEGVHQLRVSLRKMRTVLIIFKPYIHSKQTKQLANTLKGFAKKLDDARDLDVYLMANFAETSTPLSKLASKQREVAYQQMRKLIKSKKFNQCLKKWKKSFKKDLWQKNISKAQRKALKKPIKPLAIEILETYRKDILALSKQHSTLTDEELHQLRIKFKKLRYAAEFFADFFDSDPMNTFIKQIKTLQDNLGDIHDCYVVKALHQKTLPPDCNDPKVIAEKTQIEARHTDISQSLKPTFREHYQHFCQLALPWGAISTEP